jgi:prolipoprotein diacylglyceryltransferase
MAPVLLEIGPVRLWYYGLAYAIVLLIINQRVRRRRERLGWSLRGVFDFSVQFAVSVLLGRSGVRCRLLRVGLLTRSILGS